MSENYETISFETASEFLAGIRRSNTRWQSKGDWFTPWVFRGQPNSDWALIPSAWRESTRRTNYFEAIFNSADDIFLDRIIFDNRNTLPNFNPTRERMRYFAVQRAFEFSQARAFVALADELGMNVPGEPLPSQLDYQILRHESLGRAPHPAYALAQHHGMSTRLLDWTSNPLNAAFFAAEAAENFGDSLAVWALNTIELNVPGESWREFRLPRSQIGFLHSQSGLFIHHIAADLYFVSSGEWPSLEQYSTPKILRKLTLPSNQAIELRRLLFLEGVSKAHLMPTLDNVTKTLKDHWKDLLPPTELPRQDQEIQIEVSGHGTKVGRDNDDGVDETTPMHDGNVIDVQLPTDPPSTT